MNVSLSSIQRDTTIQCRAQICIETVNAYAEDMTDGAKFPEVVLFGTADKCWIGDGWHRVMAAEQIGAIDIPGELRKGGRVDALKYALGANAVHGQRRSNADKRRCVEIAVKEFPKLSSRAIAEMCGVSHMTVQRTMPDQLEQSSTSAVTGTDGKQYPAARKSSTSFAERYTSETRPPDPLSGKIVLPPVDSEEDAKSETANLVGLKRYWRMANKRERRDFLAWCKDS